MKAPRVQYLKFTEAKFNEAMRRNGERDGIEHACAEIAEYIAAHQAAGVYMESRVKAIMYCEGIKIVLKRMLPHLWVIVAVKFIGHMPISWPVYVLKRIKRGACEFICRVVDHWRWRELPIPNASC